MTTRQVKAIRRLRRQGHVRPWIAKCLGLSRRDIAAALNNSRPEPPPPPPPSEAEIECRDKPPGRSVAEHAYAVWMNFQGECTLRQCVVWCEDRK